VTVPRATKKAWGAKLEKLADDCRKAQEDLLVGIYQARQAGLSQADVAYNVGGISPTGVRPKEEKGKAIFEARRGSKGGQRKP
jgi:hypothetical protein